ncbi:MAG: V-type ATPase subunit [Anaerohalosphaeraceae bacterium]|nr:V-type ATPase subunit [Anaerohalosphaeraceae bacterium]
MPVLEEQPVFHFSLYPPLGQEDWNYSTAAAQVRTLEDKMFDRAQLAEMANAASYKAATEILSGSEYNISPEADFKTIETMLSDRRTETTKLCKELLEDYRIVEYLSARSDFANMRLAIRRLVLEQPLGTDYSNSGNVAVDDFEQVFEQEDYSSLPVYLQEGIEAGVLGYYKNKNVRDIDIAIDKAQAWFQLQNAKHIGSIFLVELQKMYIDINNIRTILRLKFTESQDRDVFTSGGYLDTHRLSGYVDMGYESFPSAFASTPYCDIIHSGLGYLQKENSFLKLEAACDEHLLGYLKTTTEITAGYQPVVAYMLRKEHEIRMVRMLLTAKRNLLEPKLILDRLCV